MEGSAETNTVTEREDERFENGELGPEQYQPGREEPHELVETSRSRVEEGGNLVLKDDREFQEDLQQHRGEHHDRERVDGDVLPVFGEQAQHREIHEGCGQVAHEPPLPERGRVLKGLPYRGAGRCRHLLSPKLGAPSLSVKSNWRGPPAAFDWEMGRLPDSNLAAVTVSSMLSCSVRSGTP